MKSKRIFLVTVAAIVVVAIAGMVYLEFEVEPLRIQCTLDTGFRDAEYRILMRSSNELGYRLYYEIKDSGEEVVPTTYFRMLDFSLDPSDFSVVHSVRPELVGLVHGSMPFSILAMHDFGTSDDWPATLDSEEAAGLLVLFNSGSDSAEYTLGVR